MLHNFSSGSRQALLPFEAALMKSSMANLFNSAVVDAAALNTFHYESELAKIGNGVPPLQHTIEIGLMWRSVIEMVGGDEH